MIHCGRILNDSEGKITKNGRKNNKKDTILISCREKIEYNGDVKKPIGERSRNSRSPFLMIIKIVVAICC